MNSPRVSIIIPCYNARVTLRECLESMRSQSFGDWEAIVVDDGSTDDSGTIVEELRQVDGRIRLCRQENQGLAGARNSGLAVARGDMINFLDADDMLLPSFLERLTGCLDDNPEYDAAYSHWILTDEATVDRNWSGGIRRKGEMFTQLAHSNPFPCHTLLIRRRALAELGGFDASLRYCEDWDLWVRLARSGALFTCVPEPLVLYRLMTTSLSRNPVPFFEAGREVIRRAHDVESRMSTACPEFAAGCSCGAADAVMNWAVLCSGIAVGQQQPDIAGKLLQTVADDLQRPLTPEMFAHLGHPVFYGAAAQLGDWETLSRRTGSSLLEFFGCLERDLAHPGFALKAMVQLFRETPGPSNHVPAPELQWSADRVSGRRLLKLLGAKIASRITQILPRQKLSSNRVP